MADEVQEQKRELTPKQRAFVNFYVGEARGNATKAARLAGYAGEDEVLRSVGHENLTKLHIRQAISERTSEYAMSPEEILAEYADIARNSSVVPFVDNETFGKPTLMLADKDGKLRPEARFIKKVTVTTDSVAVEVYDRVTALDRLAKYHGLTPDKLRLEIEDVTQLSDDELRDIAAGKTVRSER